MGSKKFKQTLPGEFTGIASETKWDWRLGSIGKLGLAQTSLST